MLHTVWVHSVRWYQVRSPAQPPLLSVIILWGEMGAAVLKSNCARYVSADSLQLHQEREASMDHVSSVRCVCVCVCSCCPDSRI